MWTGPRSRWPSSGTPAASRPASAVRGACVLALNVQEQATHRTNYGGYFLCGNHITPPCLFLCSRCQVHAWGMFVWFFVWLFDCFFLFRMQSRDVKPSQREVRDKYTHNNDNKTTNSGAPSSYELATEVLVFFSAAATDDDDGFGLFS